MAKTSGTKSKNRAPSLHSRAARRAESPSINLDKSITSIDASASKESTFFSVHNSGIKKKKAKPLTRNQKQKHQKGLERADIVKEQIEVKKQKSFGKAKIIKERAKEWEDLNSKIEAQQSKEGQDGSFAGRAAEATKIAELNGVLQTVEAGIQADKDLNRDLLAAEQLFSKVDVQEAEAAEPAPVPTKEPEEVEDEIL